MPSISQQYKTKLAGSNKTYGQCRRVGARRVLGPYLTL